MGKTKAFSGHTSSLLIKYLLNRISILIAGFIDDWSGFRRFVVQVFCDYRGRYLIEKVNINNFALAFIAVESL